MRALVKFVIELFLQTAERIAVRGDSRARSSTEDVLDRTAH